MQNPARSPLTQSGLPVGLFRLRNTRSCLHDSMLVVGGPFKARFPCCLFPFSSASHRSSFLPSVWWPDVEGFRDFAVLKISAHTQILVLSGFSMLDNESCPVSLLSQGCFVLLYLFLPVRPQHSTPEKCGILMKSFKQMPLSSQRTLLFATLRPV